jgi:hypothetical protein
MGLRDYLKDLLGESTIPSSPNLEVLAKETASQVALRGLDHDCCTKECEATRTRALIAAGQFLTEEETEREKAKLLKHTF